MASKKTAVFDFNEIDGGEGGAEDGQKGLGEQRARGSASTRSSTGMTRGSVGSRNVAVANGSSQRQSQNGFAPNGRVSSLEPGARPSEHKGKCGSGSFFGPYRDGPKLVDVPKARTNGKGVEGRQARKLREDREDDEIADVTPPERKAAVRGTAIASLVRRGGERQNKRRMRKGEEELAPDSEAESEQDVFGVEYPKARPQKKAGFGEIENGETAAERSGRGWRTKKRRASEGGGIDQDEMPPEKKSRAGQQNGRRQVDDKDPEYKPSSSRCAVKRFPQNARKAKGEAEVINLDSEETPYKGTPAEPDHHDAAPRKLDLEPPTQAGPSVNQQDQDKTYVTGRCWLGIFTAEQCTVFFDAVRLRVTVPSQYVRGGADSVTISWDLETLTSGKSFLQEANPTDTILITFHFKGPVHPSLVPFLDPRSKDLRARTVAFEVDLDEWRQTQKVGAWPTNLKEHFELIEPQDVPRFTDGRPTNNSTLLDPEAEPRLTAAPGGSGHNTRSRCHPKPSIKTFHFPLNDPDAVTISTSDLARLEEHEFLNDTLIDFYIKFLQESNSSSEHRERIHTVNSFFFKKLTETVQEARKRGVKREEAFRRMNKWTRKVNIFEKCYLIVPVNQSLHWSLAIVVYPGGGDTVNGKLETGREMRTPCILQLDSMAGGHANVEDLLRTYLTELWLSTHPDEERPPSSEPLPRFSRADMPFISVKVPQQDNHCDCGLFLLHYVEHFIADPPRIFDRRQRNWRKGLYQMSPNWFKPSEASAKRFYLRELIMRLAEQLGPGDTSILEPDALKALWMDVVGSDVQTRDSARRRQGSGQANRGGQGGPSAGPAGRGPTEEDRGKVGQNSGDVKASSRERPGTLDRERNEGPVGRSAYDEVDEGRAVEPTGRGSKGRKPLPAALVNDVLNEMVPGEEGPDVYLSIKLDETPEKGKQGAAAAAYRGRGGHQTDAPSSEDPEDPLECYRKVYHQMAPGASKPAAGALATRAAGELPGVGNDPAGHADVGGAEDKDSVPDSEDEEEVGRGTKRDRSKRETSGKPGGVEPTETAEASKKRCKRARSDSGDPESDLESAQGSPARGQATDRNTSEAFAGHTRREGSPTNLERLRLDTEEYEDGDLDGGRTTLGASDGRELASVPPRSGSLGLGGSLERVTLQEGPQADGFWAEIERPASILGAASDWGNEGGSQEIDGEKQLVVHPAAGEFPDTAEVGGEAYSDGEAVWGGQQPEGGEQEGTAASELRRQLEEAEGMAGGEREWAQGTEGGGRDEEELRAGFGTSRGGLDADSRDPKGEEPSAGFSQKVPESPWLIGRERGGRQRTLAETTAGETLKEEIKKRVLRAVGKEAAESSAPEDSQSAFAAELGILGGSASKWDGFWGSGNRPGVGGRAPMEQEPRGMPPFRDEEAGVREAERDGDLATDGRVRRGAVDVDVECLGLGKGPQADKKRLYMLSRKGESALKRDHIDLDGGSSAEEGGNPLTAAIGGSAASRKGTGPRKKSQEEIMQQMRPPKNGEGAGGGRADGGTLAKEVDVAFDGEVGRGTVPASKQIRDLDDLEMRRLGEFESTLLERMESGAQSGDANARGRDERKVEPEAATGKDDKEKRRKAMLARAKEKLMSGLEEAPPVGESEGVLVTEARKMLEEPSMPGGRLAAAEVDGDRLRGEFANGTEKDERSAGGLAAVDLECDVGGAESGPISQDFSQGGRGGHDSPRGESEGWEQRSRDGRSEDGHEFGGFESTLRTSKPGGERLPGEEGPGNDDTCSAGDPTEARLDPAQKRQKTANEEVEGPDIEMLDPLPSARWLFQPPQPTATGIAAQPNGLRSDQTPPSALEKQGGRATGGVPLWPVFGAPGNVGSRVAATQQGTGAQRRSPRNCEYGGNSGGGKVRDGAKRFAQELASAKKTNLLRSGALVRKGEQSAKSIQPVVGDWCTDGAQREDASSVDSEEGWTDAGQTGGPLQTGVRSGLGQGGLEHPETADGTGSDPAGFGGRNGFQESTRAHQRSRNDLSGLTAGHQDELFHPSDTDSPAHARNSKSLRELSLEDKQRSRGGLVGPESRKDGRGRPATEFSGKSPAAVSENVKEDRSRTPSVKRKAEVVTLDSDDEDTGPKEDERFEETQHSGRAKRSTRAEFKSQERKKSMEKELQNRRKKSMRATGDLRSSNSDVVL